MGQPVLRLRRDADHADRAVPLRVMAAVSPCPSVLARRASRMKRSAASGG